MEEKNEPSIWRLQVNTSSGSIANYCIENRVAAMGWSLTNSKIPIERLQNIITFNDYEKLAAEYNIPVAGSVKRLNEIQENDLIWMRYKGNYYIARKTRISKWIYNLGAINNDAAIQLSNIKWIPISKYADESSVPGCVATSFIRGSTFQRINKPAIVEYSIMLYNSVCDAVQDDYRYKPPEMSLTEEKFYSLLQPSDVEDLLALYLYDQYGYITIPSTNKNGTPLYECVMLDPRGKERKHIYIQAKIGEKNKIDANEYAHLSGEIYLISTHGKVFNAEKYSNIHNMNPTEIYNFAVNPDKRSIIPESIERWINFLTPNHLPTH